MEEIAHTKVDFGWYFPSIGEYASLLEQHGLAVQVALLFDRPTKLEEGDKGLRNWIQMFGDRIFTSVSEEVKQQVLQQTEQKVREQLFRDGSWFADYRRLRIVAHKK